MSNIATCNHCGKGKFKIRAGYAVCDWCGISVDLGNTVPYRELKRGELFVSQYDDPENPCILKKGRGEWIKGSNGNKHRLAPECGVVPLTRLERTRKKREKQDAR